MNTGALLATLLLASSLTPLAIGDATSVHDRNLAYLWSIVGDVDPSTPVAFADGRTMSLSAAIEDAAARAGDVDLGAMTTGAAPVGFANTYVGDVWLISIGPGVCTSTSIAPGSPVFVPLDPQHWIYSGSIGQMSAHADMLTIASWTLKTSGAYSDVDWTATGQLDFYCFSFSGYHLAFPFVNGIVTVEE